MKNNLTHNYGVVPSRGIQLNPGYADQVDSAGYNAWSNVAIPYYPASGNEVNYIGHDIDLGTIGPEFVDPSRTFASFDFNGDSAHGIEEFLKINQTNSNCHYIIAGLLSYQREGFRPLDVRLKGTGENGADIGAVPFQ
ncbi:MAG: hypothetical protein GY760_11155 [Deltaproteobacteria bacterium]|nr:hypothetical protein [Deltaproteobacteria bacterium]